ncbi:MFS transporter, partial [Bacillus sp. JJ1764]
ATGLVCLMLEGFSLILLSQTHYVVFAFLLFCGAAFMSGIGNACFDTVLMKEIPEEYQGTMFGLLATISNPILGLSMFISGAALEFLAPRTMGVIGGMAYMLVAIVMLISFFSRGFRKKTTIGE